MVAKMRSGPTEAQVQQSLNAIACFVANAACLIGLTSEAYAEELAVWAEKEMPKYDLNSWKGLAQWQRVCAARAVQILAVQFP